MANMQDIVRLAVDTYKGRVENFSDEQTAKRAPEVLREALIEANNGKTEINYRDIRDGKCNGLFALVETILSETVVEGLQGDEFFNSIVDFRNVAAGDQNLFLIEDNDLYVVAEIAEGTQGIRRQRLGGLRETSIPTSLKAVRIYEELNRILAGRVDFNKFIDKVAASFKRKLMDDVFALWTGITADQLGGAVYFPEAGPYDEDDLLDLIAHIEAASGGKTATIIGTKKALRKLVPSIIAEQGKQDLYNDGYFGKFYGNPVIAVPQRHRVGTNDFILDDDVITIIAGDAKPIKVVYEGDPLVIMGDPLANADLTQEYFYAERYGVGLVTTGRNNGIGIYTMVAEGADDEGDNG